MQKISQKSQNLSKISGFQKNFKIAISHHLDKQKIYITRLILKIQDSNCTNFYRRKNHILASRSKDHFLRLKYIFLSPNSLNPLPHARTEQFWHTSCLLLKLQFSGLKCELFKSQLSSTHLEVNQTLYHHQPLTHKELYSRYVFDNLRQLFQSI